MSNKTCGECKHFFLNSEGHCKSNDGSENAHNDACSFFEPKVITNGDKIIAGGMRAIAEVAKKRCRHCIYKNDPYCFEVDCVGGIEAWLNAPAESEKEK